MKQVLREQPGADPFCYFSQMGGWWLVSVHGALTTRDYSNGAMRASFQFDHGDTGNNPVIPIQYMDGDRVVTITSRLIPAYTGSAYDIPYFHALGWL
jgi:hypothetical protein